LRVAIGFLGQAQELEGGFGIHDVANHLGHRVA
jgi:hypothetical protein